VTRVLARAIALWCLPALGAALPGAGDLPPGPKGAYAFIGVNVLPMDTDRVLRNQTVLVEAERISAIGPDGSVRLPANVTRIEARGRWLMPGLIDAHTHERALPDWPDDVAGNLAMYLANGITSIVNMGDFTGGMIAVRDAVRSGALAGPEIYVGHFVRGPSDGGTSDTLVATPEAASALARRAAAQGYDFLKVYDGLSTTAYDALAAEARVVGLPIAGHAVRQPGLPHTLSGGQVMAAHASIFLPGAGGTGAPASLPAATQLALASGVYVTATLFVHELITGYGLDALAGVDPYPRVIAQDGVEFMDDRCQEAWFRMLQQRVDIRLPRDRRGELALQQQYVRAFDVAGVPILLGTDTIGIPGVVPGFAVHGELRQLREAGLPPWRVLATGTRNAGRFLRQHLRAADAVGRIEAGARADLLLLERDPREDPGTLRRSLLVMARGRPYTRDTLWAHLDALRSAR
jgi:imidazolonepropionase-like amidohydrolase